MRLNVDVKVQNDPDRLFSLMYTIISAQHGWETQLAPRILLGLWHPCFLSSAKAHLPYCRRSYIGVSPWIARKYFWDDCDTFSLLFAALTSRDGQRLVSILAYASPARVVRQIPHGVQGGEEGRDGVDGQYAGPYDGGKSLRCVTFALA